MKNNYKISHHKTGKNQTNGGKMYKNNRSNLFLKKKQKPIEQTALGGDILT